MRDHSLIEERIAARALGGLDADADDELRREMAGHGPDCAECRRLEAQYDEVAGRLAFALDPAPLRPGFEDAVVTVAVSEREAISREQGEERRRRRARPAQPLLRPLAAVAAAVALFAGGWAIGALTSGDEGDPLEGARVIAFEGDPGASLSLAYRPGEEGVYVLGSGLDVRAEGTVYEFWTFRGDTPVPGGCFRPGQDGSVFALLPASVGETTRLLAVTVESASCPSAPTTEPVFVAELA